MITPTDHQRTFFEKIPPRPTKGLDRVSDYLLGRWWSSSLVEKRIKSFGKKISELRNSLEACTDRELGDRVKKLGQSRRRYPQQVEQFLVEAIAALAVVFHRQLGLRAYDVQLVASSALACGYFAEVETGEGKTLSIALAAAYHALGGLPCHIITANDYLAQRDSEYLEPFFRKVGLSVGSVLGEDKDEDRTRAYSCDITYTTAKEVAADYLRDRLRTSFNQGVSTRRLNQLSRGDRHTLPTVQRGLGIALIDEADHALIDEAVTPLIISKPVESDTFEEAAPAAWAVARTLEPEVHYQINRSFKTITLLESGVEKILQEIKLPQRGIWAGKQRRLQIARQALEAKEFFHKDEQYILEDEKIVIVDASTGRPMPMRSWQHGLHQIIQAKEGLPVGGVADTIARTSFQSFFRKYHKICGASGTLREAASEIWRVYHVPFIRVPRNLPCTRQNRGIIFCENTESRDQQLLRVVKECYEQGQPVLIVARTVSQSERTAALLTRAGLPGIERVLNASQHSREASIIALAGHKFAVTIATGMAGRGTDIRLETGVEKLGGLHVISIEANESFRVDRQLFGRSARQGDPGSVRSIFAVNDPLFMTHLSTVIISLLQRLLSVNASSKIAQFLGFLMLKYCQFRARISDTNRRRLMLLSDEQIKRSMGFTSMDRS